MALGLHSLGRSEKRYSDLKSIKTQIWRRRNTMQAPSVSIRRRQKISTQVRDQIVLEHLPLVKAIAIRVHENLPVHVDVDDLVHAGILGLFDAASKYNP